MLLVYANPAITASPVPPYGMECVAHAFRVAGCDVALLMPYIDEDPVLSTRDAIEAMKPDLVALSVRNIDDALVVRGPEGPGDIDTAFYLDEVRVLVASVIGQVGRDKVIGGGPALSAGTEDVARYLGLRWAIGGPAEDLCWRIGRALVTTGNPSIGMDARIVDTSDRAGEPLAAQPSHQSPEDITLQPSFLPNARSTAASVARREAFATWRPVPGPTPRMGDAVRLAIARQARLAVTISTGCDRRCIFCVEAAYTGWSVKPRDVEHVVAEIAMLAQAGVRRFWLACSEANVPGNTHTISILRELSARGLAKPGGPLDFALFVQPAPVDDPFLDALEAAGIDPTGLSFEFGHLDDTILRDGGGPSNRAQIDALVELWLRRGYRELGGSILLGAHPRETGTTLDSALAAAREIDLAFPRGLGLAYACGARVYPGSPLADRIRALGTANLYCRAGDTIDPQFVRPVVYCQPGSPRALARHVAASLAGTRGQMKPMNAEAVANPHILEGERAVNRGIVRRAQQRFDEAAVSFELALTHVPNHAEALAQAAQLYANDLGQPADAVRCLRALLATFRPDDPRETEIRRALTALGHDGH